MGNSLVGTIQTLFIENKSESGYTLTHGSQSIFLSHKEQKTELDIGDYVKVFLYINRDGEMVATTTLPHIIMGTYGWATIVKVISNLGLFVDIGTTEDILVSIDDLPIYKKIWPNVDDQLYVTLGLDQNGRLLAIPATEREMESILEFADFETVTINDQVKGTIYFTSKEGSVMLTEEHYRGFIHYTEREKEPRLGEQVTGRVIDVKDDGTLNVSLLPLKHERIDDDAEKIVAYLIEHSGTMSFNDRSRPEDIRNTFNMSKSAFKRALGRLMKERKVTQS